MNGAAKQCAEMWDVRNSAQTVVLHFKGATQVGKSQCYSHVSGFPIMSLWSSALPLSKCHRLS